MVEIENGRKVESRQNEVNRYDYIPLRIGVISSPLNFLFAIMAGTTVTAVVTLLKPPSTTPVIAYKVKLQSVGVFFIRH